MEGEVGCVPPARTTPFPAWGHLADRGAFPATDLSEQETSNDPPSIFSSDSNPKPRFACHHRLVLDRSPPGLRREAREAYLPKVGLLVFCEAIQLPQRLPRTHAI